VPTVQELYAAKAASGSAGASGDSGSVYLGSTSRVDASRDALVAGSDTPHIVSADEAKLMFFKDDALRLKWQQQLYDMGLTKSADDYESALSAWNKAVDLATSYQAAGRNVSPWDVLDLVGHGAGAINTEPKTTTSTSKSTNLPSKTDIEHAVRSMFQEQVGRDPSASELARYRGIALAEAKRNPSITTTTTTTDSSGNSTSSSQSSGGVNLDEVLGQNVSDDPEHGAYQAATYYFNAMTQALGAPV
jgi:hypothetical protein